MQSDFNLLFYSNDDMVLFTQNKVASRMCDFYFQKIGTFSLTYGLSQPLKDIPFRYEINSFYAGGQNNNSSKPESVDYAIKSFQDLVSNNSEKDIYFLYREPNLRLISGLYQEFSSFTADRLFLDIWLNKFNDDDANEILNYFSIHGTSATNFDEVTIHRLEKLQTESLHNNLKIMVSDWLKAIARASAYNLIHIRNYINFYIHFMMAYNIDSSRVNLVDIDKIDVENIFSKYESKESIRKRIPFKRDDEGNIIKTAFSDIFLKNIFREIVFDEGYWSTQKINFYQTISDYIREETWAYHTLKLISAKKENDNIDILKII